MKLVEAYRLEKRIAMLERSIGRGGAPSIAMNMWKFLSDNGPSTVDDITAGLGPRYSNKPTLQSYLDAGLITKNGDRYAANPDYEWDDVGKISSPYRLNIADAQLPTDNGEVAAEEPSQKDASSTQDRPGRGRQRAVKANLFSRKFDEVKAAVDSGIDVNSVNATGKTALQFAIMSDKQDSAEIVKYLIQHGAALTKYSNGKPLIVEALNRGGNPEIIEALMKAGADVYNYYKNKRVYEWVVDAEYKGSLLPFAMLSDVPMYVDDLMETFIKFKNVFGSNKVEEFLDKMMDLILNEHADDSLSAYIDDALIMEISSGGSGSIDKSVILNKLKKAKIWSNAIVSAIHWNQVERLLPLMEMAHNENWRLVDVSESQFASLALTFVGTSNSDRLLNTKFISDIITPEAIRQLGSSNLFSSRLINLAGRIQSVKILDSIAKSRIELTPSDVSDIIYILASRNTVPTREFSRAACKLIRKSLKRFTINNADLGFIAGCNNEYLIEFLIESDYGEKLSSDRFRHSSVCKNALEKAGYTIGSYYDSNSGKQYSYFDVDKIATGIIRDESDGVFRAILKQYPDIVNEPKIQNVLDDNRYADNFTARFVNQVRSELSGGKPKYDF